MANEPRTKGEDRKRVQVLKEFGGINTQADRTAIGENEFSWIENVMPIGHGNMPVVPQATLFGTISSASTPIHERQINLGGVIYNVVFWSDGSATATNRDTLANITIGSTATFSTAGVRASSWENVYLLIIDPSKGLFLWDGTNLVHVGSIGLILITAGGSGYTSIPQVTISAPNDTGGKQAVATAAITSGAVTSITLTEPGTGYTSPATITITGGGGSGATAVAAMQTFATGTLTANVTAGGSGYTSAPSVSLSGGTGSGGSAIAILSGDQVGAVVFINPGSYTVAPSISFSGGGGSGAAATAVINTTKNVDVATFSGQVWIASGRTIFYSAAGTVDNFTGTSAGNIILSDETLFGNITALTSANNFLYIFGETSINVISDIRLTSAGATTFTNTNVSASIGTRYPDVIIPYFRSIVFMNDYGIYALVGSTASKLSDALDGIFQNIDFTSTLSCSLAVVFGKLCLIFCFKTTSDPFLSQSRALQAIFFDKKWTISSQQASGALVSSVFSGESPSGPVSYGFVNYLGKTRMCQLFSTTNNAATAYVQTALWSLGEDSRLKQATRYGVDVVSATQVSIKTSADTERGLGVTQLRSSSNAISFVNASGIAVSFINASGNPVLFTNGSSAYNFLTGMASNYGRYLGMTVSTQTPNAVFSGLMLEYEERADWARGGA
jgi:hypothetical protein